VKGRSIKRSKAPIRARHIAIHGDVMLVVDDRGRAWERREHMPVGEWGLVPLPADEAAPTERNVRKK
jgi:hypothetical protein